ncbi:MAG: HEAT repeat domain-containing protein, partial [Myxococcales bacterium]
PGTSSSGGGPLEHFLELSGPLSTTGPGWPGLAGGHSIEELEVEMEVYPQAEVVSSAPAVPDGDAGDGPDSDSDSDFATAALCRRARDVHDKGRLLALRALRQRLDHPATQALLEELRAAAADSGRVAGETVSAIDALGELRDGAVIPAMIDRLDASASSEVAEAAHRALVATCAQDFGRSRRRWRTWARDHGARPRVEWLIDGLAHKQAAIRTAAIEELRHLAGDSFGYLPGSPKNERDRVRRRFAAWWQQLAHPETAISGQVCRPPGKQGAFLPPAEEAPLPPTPKAR